MYKAIILICFYSIAVMADEDSEVCLGVKKLEQDKLTFFYTKQDESNNPKPYFYAKVTEESKELEITLDAVLRIKQHLSVISTTAEIKQYEVSKNMKKLYVVRSKNPLPDFNPSEHIVPSRRSNETNIVGIKKKKRGASGYPIDLPEPQEQKKRGAVAVAMDDDVAICEFDL